MNHRLQVRIAALVMFLAIALGAMGAHALEDRLTGSGHLNHWKTAALYQMVHGLALFTIALVSRAEKATLSYWMWLVGVLLFSGSLNVLCLTGFTRLGAITPLGGLAFMIGWLALIFRPSAALGNKD